VRRERLVNTEVRKEIRAQRERRDRRVMMEVRWVRLDLLAQPVLMAIKALQEIKVFKGK
jgi:hypothetical protein